MDNSVNILNATELYTSEWLKFLQRRYTDSQQTREKMLNITHQGNANKTTMRYHLTPVRMAKIKTQETTSIGKDVEKRLHCWWECKLVQPLWKTEQSFLKKLKIELPYKPATALLGIYSKNTKILIHRDTCPSMLIAALRTRAKLWKWPKCPTTNEWIKKVWYVCDLFIHSLIEGHMICFHVLAIVNNITINIRVHVSLWIRIVVSFG